jgi:hypothetical protein
MRRLQWSASSATNVKTILGEGSCMDRYEFIKQCMDFLTTYGKPFGVILGAGVSAYKLWFSRRKTLVSHLNERSERTRKFMDEGGSNLHPFIMENSFAAIVGHIKLSANEITAILQQSEPNTFMKDYLDARPYAKIESTQSVNQLVLQPKYSAVRWMIKFFCMALYSVFSLSAFSFLLYLIPKTLSSGDIGKSIASILAVIFFGGGAAFFLWEGRRITISERLARMWR